MLCLQDPTAAACVTVAYGREHPSSPPDRMSEVNRRPDWLAKNAAAALAEVLEDGEPQEQEEIAQGSEGSLALVGEDGKQHGAVSLSEHEEPSVSGRASQGHADEQQVAQEEPWTGTSSSGGSMRSAASEDEGPEDAKASSGGREAGPAATVLQDLSLDSQAVANLAAPTPSEAETGVEGSCETSAGRAPRNLARTRRESKRRQATERSHHERGARSLGSAPALPRLLACVIRLADVRHVCITCHIFSSAPMPSTGSVGDPTAVLCRAKGQPKAKTAVGDIPVSAVMLNNEELQKVAKHCNERKTAAKSCSVRPSNM